MFRVPSISSGKSHESECPSYTSLDPGPSSTKPAGGDETPSMRLSKVANGGPSTRVAYSSRMCAKGPGSQLLEILDIFRFRRSRFDISLPPSPTIPPQVPIVTIASHAPQKSTYTPFPEPAGENFRPAQSQNDEIVLISSEGARHITSRSLITTYSTYFADILSTQSHPANPIVLPLTDRAGLNLVLKVLENCEQRTRSAPIDLCLYEVTLCDLIAAAEAAAMYNRNDIPIFRTSFSIPVVELPEHLNYPLMRFAFAAVTLPPSSLSQIAIESLQEQNASEGLVDSIFSVLERYAPDQLKRLESYYERFTKARSVFFRRLHEGPLNPTHGAAGDEGFASKCVGKCSIWRRYEGDWAVYREKVAELYFGLVMLAPGEFIREDDLRGMFGEVVGTKRECRVGMYYEDVPDGCMTCELRISLAFRKELKVFHEVVWSY